ncbi:MAG TPA: methyl-accepting chemotaxis protein [Gemmatimonadales bacterium]|nr:methyl-accepting chemotaxis protein [Gemmatimonadales bacterium]
MSPAARTAPQRALAVRLFVAGGAVVALLAALAGYATGRIPLPPDFGLGLVVLVGAGALARRYGIPLPGNGFTSYILGVVVYAVLWRGWAFAAAVAPLAMMLGDVFLRRVSVRAALGNAAHLTTGTALTGLIYARLGGVFGADALTAANVGPVAAALLLLPIVVNGTFYLELSLAQAFAWLDARLTARWEAVVFVTSAALALGWLVLTTANIALGPEIVIAVALLAVTVGSLRVIRLGVRADELDLVQRLSHAIAAEIDIERSFVHIQELTRELVPWEHMGLARYTPSTHQMELVADTSTPVGVTGRFQYDADAGLTGEAVRARRPLVAHGLRREQVVTRGEETPGAEVLVPLYHAGGLVGVWSVRHSDPAMYRPSDGDLLALLAPQLALMLAIAGTIQPVIGAADRTTQYVQTLTSTAEEIHASSEEVAAAAERASRGAGEAATLVDAAERQAGELRRGADQVVTAGEETRDAGAAMERAADKVRAATQDATRRLTDLGATTEESVTEVQRLREVATHVEKFSETIGFVANQTNLLALNATIEAARAGAHGRGFAVVADEVHKLAEESGREARNVGRSVQDTRRALDRAAQLLERIRGDLRDVVQSAAEWVTELNQITEAAGGTARAGKHMAELARANAELAARIAQALTQAKTGAQLSSQEAQTVAAAAAEQLRAIEELARGATELAQLSTDLSRTVHFVRGHDGRA